MTASELKQLKRTRGIVATATLLLLIGQVSYLFYNTAQYLFAVLTALLVAGIKWYLWKKSGQEASQKTLILLVLVLSILSPVLIFLFKVLFLGEPLLGIEVFLTIAFVVPIILLIIADRQLVKIIANQA